MMIGWQNRFDSAILSSTSEISTLPAAYAQHPHLSRKWHTAAGVKSAGLIIDFGLSLSAALLGVMGTNLTSTATMQLRSSDIDPTVTTNLEYDSGSIAAGVKDGYGAIYKSFTSTNSRYWRLDLADASVISNLQIGRVYLGPYWQPGINMELDWSVTPLDESRMARSYGGQSYPDARPKRRVLQFTLDFQTEVDMYDNAFALARVHGIVGDILAIPDIAGTYVSEQSVWGQLATSEPISEPRLGLFRQRYAVVERL